ncbi:MAG TPA: HAMP domain-containing sensor histidine kinase [Acidimicrobiales bacterium]|nr:HAMP domain-containing sensor histidine kinase [Acidimicrobiales bacterium]
MSLRRRLTLSMAVVLVVALAVANVVTYSSLRSFLYGRLDDQIDGAQLHAYNYLIAVSRRGYAPREQALDERVSPDTYVMLLSHSGKVLLSSPSGTPANPDPRPLVPASLRPAPVPRSHHFGAFGGAYHSENNDAAVGSVGTSGVRYRESAVDVPQGVLVVAESLNSTTDTLSSLVRVQIGASLAVLAVLCAIVLFTLRRGLRPLETMAETTDAIAAGDLTQRVPIGRASSEVGRLGDALNAMLTRIEEAFREKSASEARLRQFVADASHELRTPLTSIRGYTELLRKGAFTDDESQGRALQRVEREADRMGLLVADLLLLARLDQGRPIDQVPVDLRRVGADAVADARAVDPERPVELVAGGPVVVRGDRDRLGQVAHNLVRNALEHTAPGTPVRVEVRADATTGYMSVTDEGPGLSQESASRVFDRFWRDDAARTGGGTGLGLAIVRAIAEVLGGSATVVSSPGHGATFEVAIPLDRSEPRKGRPTDPGSLAERPQRVSS